MHPLGGAVDIIAVNQPDGSYRSAPWYVRFGRFQGVLKGAEKVVAITVNGVDANFQMLLDNSGQAYFMRELVHGSESSGMGSESQRKKRLATSLNLWCGSSSGDFSHSGVVWEAGILGDLYMPHENVMFDSGNQSDAFKDLVDVPVEKDESHYVSVNGDGLLRLSESRNKDEGYQPLPSKDEVNDVPKNDDGYQSLATEDEACAVPLLENDATRKVSADIDKYLEEEVDISAVTSGNKTESKESSVHCGKVSDLSHVGGSHDKTRDVDSSENKEDVSSGIVASTTDGGSAKDKLGSIPENSTADDKLNKEEHPQLQKGLARNRPSISRRSLPSSNNILSWRMFSSYLDHQL
ncbi:hypothetical protein GUJ93_ZPchr0010g10492 [Zizania palustris]|uniref:Lipin N-terminal domain-containing protein n=1 Tax=Zizania palustris TaxID=103762 RepID=A0A8J6BER9_ZIZPA|nr:hypothetical protein GUJ93_ZPchr0010g10492 [Zizania palustris]